MPVARRKVRRVHPHRRRLARSPRVSERRRSSGRWGSPAGGATHALDRQQLRKDHRKDHGPTDQATGPRGFKKCRHEEHPDAGQEDHLQENREERVEVRFDGARMISMRRPRPFRFCWCGRPRSMLNRASKYSPACRSNSPFFVPDQPSACTLLTWCPVNSAARARGRFSSSRTRTGQNEIARQIQRSERLFLRHRGELVEEMVERLSAFQVVARATAWTLACRPESREHPVLRDRFLR